MPLEPTTYRHHAISGGWTEDPLTARVRSIWSGADFHPIARSFSAGAEAFIERLALRPGETVLDVACGTGNLAIPAAEAGAVVTGIDIAPNLIATARLEALDRMVPVTFEVGDAEALPYRNGQFDTVISMFGAIFAPRPERAAAELVRVTRPGGRVVMANWTPEGFIGDLLRAHTAVIAPPADLPSPLLWGDETTVLSRFSGRFTELTTTRRFLDLRFPLSPEEVTELFATYYGPTVATLKAADPAGRHHLRTKLAELWNRGNVSTLGGTIARGEYLEVEVRVA